MEPPIQNGTAQIIEVDDSNVNDIALKSKVETPKPVKSSSTFSEMRSVFLEEISTFLLTGSVDRIKQKWNSFQAKDITKRVSMEQALKDKTVAILNTLKKNTGYSIYVQDLKKYLNAMMVLCKSELITVLLFLNILSDIIDSSPVPLCEKLFEFVEENLATWKSPPFSVGKNNILRMCNDLLRRISKAQTTVFSGRILLFLAMFFPFSERSGLNIVSEFNTDTFYKCENPNEEELVEIVDVSLKLDDEFYSKFWKLQEYFRNPNQCYNKTQWQEFVEIANIVIGVFKKNKLNRDSVDRLATQYESKHFTKFLTSRKLLVLQISDSNFRRVISFQLLVLFQYLTGQIKTKPENHELPADSNDWIKEVTDRIYAILKDTPPDGEEFVTLAKNMILREEEWSSWKNEGCPGLKKVTQADSGNVVKLSTIEDNLGQKSFSVLTTQSATNADTIFVPSKTGSPQAMTLKHSFDEYISSLTPAPELKDFLAEAIEESERKMEPEKKKVADPSFAWLSVKLISLKAPTFFSNSHSAVPSMSEYVDIMCKKLYRDLNPGLLLPPYMPAPKSVTTKTKKPLAAAGANSASLKKRFKKPKLSEIDKTVVKVVKGGVVKLVKTTKGIKVLKDGDNETNPDESESGVAQVSKVKTEEKADNEKTTEKSKVDKTNSSTKLASKSNLAASEKQVSVKKTENVPDKAPDKTFAVPSLPSKSEKHKSEKSDKVSKSPSPKPQKKPEEKLRKDDRRGDKREEKKVEKREKRSRERSVESRKEKASSDRLDRGKVTTSNKSPGKRKASPKRDDHKSSKVIRVDDSDEEITKDQIHDLAKSIASNWKKVAERLGYKSDEIEYIEQDAPSDYQRAMNVLLLWVSDEEDATKGMLRKHLKYLGLSHAASVLSK